MPHEERDFYDTSCVVRHSSRKVDFYSRNSSQTNTFQSIYISSISSTVSQLYKSEKKKKMLPQLAYTIHLTGYCRGNSFNTGCVHVCTSALLRFPRQRKQLLRKECHHFSITFKAIFKSPLIAITGAGAIAVHFRDNYI